MSAIVIVMPRSLSIHNITLETQHFKIFGGEAEFSVCETKTSILYSVCRLFSEIKCKLGRHDTPKWRTHTKFSNFLNIFFHTTQLLKIVNLYNLTKSFHLTFSAASCLCCCSQSQNNKRSIIVINLFLFYFISEPFPSEKVKKESSSGRKRSVNYTGL